MQFNLLRLLPYALMALLALTLNVGAAENPLDDLIVCVWEGPNGEC